MRALMIVLGVMLSAATLTAQVHGIPASVSSPTSRGGILQPHGIPASVTSLGPRGFSDDGIQLAPQFHNRRIGRHGFVSPQVFPVAIPFFMVTPQPIIIESAAPAQPAIPEHVEVVIRDERGRELPRADEQSNQDRTAGNPGLPPQAEPQPGPAAIIVFRNGSTRELQDYAIMGSEVFDLAGGRPRKVSLEDVDQVATARENDERGSGFHLPAL